MEVEWREVRLSEAIELIGGGTPKRKNPSYWNGNIPWLSVKDFNNDFRHVFETEESITSLGLEKSSTKLLEEGQLIISARGTVGELAVLGRPMAFNQSCYGINAKAKIATNSFLFYLLKTSILGLKKISHGAVFDTITKETFKHINALIPPLPEQKAIAHVLGSLDDKIELNRRMNETLEGMAQALFKSWFVDFDPVIDNALAAGNPIPEPLAQRAETRRQAIANGTANRETAQAFPASFRFTEELGWIPEGWEVKAIKEVCSFVSRGVTPKYELGTGKFIINQKVNRGVELDLSNLKELQNDLEVPSDKFAFKHDVLVNCLGEGTLGRVHFFTGKSSIYAVDQHMSICRAKDSETGLFLYLYLASPTGQDRIESSKTGSTGMTMFNITKVREFELYFPTSEILKLFGQSTLSYFDKVQGNRTESQTLAKLRDTLLPKLISGELRIPQAKKMVEEAIA